MITGKEAQNSFKQNRNLFFFLTFTVFKILHSLNLNLIAESKLSFNNESILLQNQNRLTIAIASMVKNILNNNILITCIKSLARSIGIELTGKINRDNFGFCGPPFQFVTFYST